MAGGNRRAILVDDHPLLGLGLQAGLAAHGVELMVVEPRESGALLSKLKNLAPTLAVVDLAMPIPGGGLGLIEPLVEAGLTVIVLTGEDDELLWAEALEKGAQVVLSKGEPIEDLLIAIARVCRGEQVRPHQRADLSYSRREHQSRMEQLLGPFQALTAREQAVLDGLMRGLTLADIANERYVSVHTVRTQAKSVLKKLNVHSQVEAVALAQRAGWVYPAP